MKDKLKKLIRQKQIRMFSSTDKKNFEAANLERYSYGYEDHKMDAKKILDDISAAK